MDAIDSMLDKVEAMLNAEDTIAAHIAELEAALSEARALLWIGWSEMNAIRARSGVPLDFDGRPQGISEEYWNEAVEKMSVFLGDDAQPWPPKEPKMKWKSAPR